MNTAITRRNAVTSGLLAVSLSCLGSSVLGKPSPANAETPNIDYASLNDEELKEIVHSAQRVLTSRTVKSDNGVLLYSTDGIEVYLMGLDTGNGGALIKILLAVLNGSNHEVKLHGEPVIVNGWNMDSYCYYGSTNVSASQNKRLEISFFCSDAMIDTYEDIASIEIGLSFLDPEDTWGSTELARTDSVTVLFDNGSIVTE